MEFRFPPIVEILKRRLQSPEWQPVLADSIVPVIALENDRPEYDFLQGAIRFGGAVRIQPQVAAGTFVHGQLHNPLGSGVLAVILRAGIAHSSPGATTFGPSEYRMTRRDAAATDLHLDQGVLDSRWDSVAPGNRRGACVMRTEVNAVLQRDLDIGRMRNAFGMIVGNVSYYGAEWDQTPLVLGPGAGFQMVSATQVANQRNDFQFTWIWVERQIAPTERASVPGGA